jgi:peptide/nickel transport system substrate-binding protein
MRTGWHLSVAVAWLALIHLLALLAGFFAPYDPTAQDRSFPFAPPTSVHLMGDGGNWNRPFVYGLSPEPGVIGRYNEDRRSRFSVRLAPSGAAYRFLGLVDSRRHLFGVDEPGHIFLMGTDEYGRDQFSRLVYGIRISLAAGLLATLLTLGAGVLLGSTAGWVGGWLDTAVMRIAELFVSLPWLYLLFGVRAFLPLKVPPEQAFLVFIGIAGIIGWARPARLVRGVVMTAKEREYVLAARGFGASQVYLLRRHIVPQIRPLLLTQASILIPRYVLAESTLSFLGLGIGEPVPSWGGLLASLQHYHTLASYWWMFLPAVVMIAVFAAFYVLSEELKEPRLRRRGIQLSGLPPTRAMRLTSLVLCVLLCLPVPTGAAPQPDRGGDFLISSGETGSPGGRLVVPLRSEPKTLNPVVALDGASRSVIERMSADLIHIARDSQQTQPALAQSWTVSSDGKQYTLRLRHGIRFSDGYPFDADDVVFTFQVYLDDKLHSPQRDLLVVDGNPITVHKVDAHTVRFELSQPYAAAERLFDSIAILPRHLLQPLYREGKLGQAWGLTTAPGGIAGLGPFRLKEYVAGQHVVLSRNPYFWGFDKAGRRLPYLEEIVLVFTGSEDSQVIRFQSGEADVVSRLSAEDFAVLERDQHRRGYRLYDLGPGLEYHFLLFNLNDLLPNSLAGVSRKQKWFRDVSFRRAVSAAIDREGIVRLVYRGRATPIASHVSPGNRFWLNRKVVSPPHSLSQARTILSNAGYSWSGDGTLVDSEGRPLEFSILTTAGNSQRSQMATIIQDDLKQLGVRVQVVALESRAVIDRIFNTFDYEAAVTALAGGDADPNVEMNVWVSGGSTHLWNLRAKGGGKPAASWEQEIDQLMKQQMITLDPKRRKQLYDRVQELVAEQLPILPLVSPNILVGAKASLGNVRPAILNDYVLWNAEQIFHREVR